MDTENMTMEQIMNWWDERNALSERTRVSAVSDDEDTFDEFLEKTFNEVTDLKNRYYHKMTVWLEFDQIHIKVLGDEFYFVPRQNSSRIRLLHKNKNKTTGYHLQFNKESSIKSVLRYCNRHAMYLYTPLRPASSHIYY